MLTIRNSDQMRTMRNVKSYRSSRTSTGVSRELAERRRLFQEEAALAQREWRRRWLAQGWGEHLWYCRLQRQGAPWVMP